LKYLFGIIPVRVKPRQAPLLLGQPTDKIRVNKAPDVSPPSLLQYGQIALMSTDKDKSKVHKLNLKGSAKLVAEFVSYSSS
jgi:hypothetical protein